jgi:hypothetical protein
MSVIGLWVAREAFSQLLFVPIASFSFPLLHAQVIIIVLVDARWKQIFIEKRTHASLLKCVKRRGGEKMIGQSSSNESSNERVTSQLLE